MSLAPSPLFPLVRPLPERFYRLGAALFFLALALVFYWPSLAWLPRGIHEWAQADRLALAISFYDNGLHLFRPQTLNIGSIDGVVGVEFPLIAYLAALAAKITGRDSIVLWFRLFNIGTASLSYYFLFRLVFERCRNVVAALLPGVFLATSPVLAYYTGNFLPDPVGAALVVVASYFLLRFGQQPRFRDLAWALGLYTLATLVKTSAGIYLVAASSVVLLWTYLQPAVLSRWQKIGFMALVAGGTGLVVAYALFNRHLNETYHSSVFLAAVKPIESVEQAEYVLTRIRELWWYEYFTEAHYIVLKASALICLISSWRIVRKEWLWASLLLVSAVGGRLFFQLMGRQFFDHDYYVLAPYWPGLALLVALAATQLATWRLGGRRWRLGLRTLGYALPGAALLALLVMGLAGYRARTHEPYRTFSANYSYRWMQGGAAALTAAHVPAGAKLLVIGEEAPNLSLVYFDRQGITWQPDMAQLTPPEITSKMGEFGLDYVLMRHEVFQQLLTAHPDLTTGFAPLISNAQYVLLQPQRQPGS